MSRRTIKSPLIGKIHLEEEERQMIVLGLAKLAVLNPGFDTYTHSIAKKMKGGEMFLAMKKVSASIDYHTWLHDGKPPEDD